MNAANITVAFHIGRGGRFNNPGHKTFNPHVHRLQDCFGDNSFIKDIDADGNQLPDDEWTLVDGGNNVILEGREAIESETGLLEWDDTYDTDIVCYLEDCDDSEIDILYNAYIDGDLHDDDIINYVCERKELYRISSVKFYKTNATIFFTDSTSLEYMWDGEDDVEEDEIKEWLEENSIDAVSIERYASDFVEHFYNN